ncbi:MAG: hypothetical protein NVS9B11_12520 [Candidatus Dormibacteraceae bacterium]
MSFQLVYGDHELTLPLPFEPHIEDLLLETLGRTTTSETEFAVLRRELSSRLVDAMTAALEFKVLPPTDKQLKYAIAIARELSLQLPPAVLQYRDAMTAFLAEHAHSYRRRKAL